MDGWITPYAAVAAGEMDVANYAVSELARHPPMTVDGFLDRYPESFRHRLPS